MCVQDIPSARPRFSLYSKSFLQVLIVDLFKLAFPTGFIGRTRSYGGGKVSVIEVVHGKTRLSILQLLVTRSYHNLDVIRH